MAQTPTPHMDPASVADELLSLAGCNLARGASESDKYHAMRLLLEMVAEDDTGQYTTADYRHMAHTMRAIVSAPTRGE